MSIRRTLTRLGAPLAAAAVVTVVAAVPASAHVTISPSDATAGAFTVLTVSVPHGCDGSPTTKVEIQMPESVLSVTPTRNPFYDVESTIEQLDEPVTDAHGNEVTERTSTVVYTANTPLPEGQRDTFELSFQVPDAAG
jgi:periplasmic copper chaperone A